MNLCLHARLRKQKIFLIKDDSNLHAYGQNNDYYEPNSGLSKRGTASKWIPLGVMDYRYVKIFNNELKPSEPSFDSSRATIYQFPGELFVCSCKIKISVLNICFSLEWSPWLTVLAILVPGQLQVLCKVSALNSIPKSEFSRFLIIIFWLSTSCHTKSNHCGGVVRLKP
jgi:hypothetical protein